jgi:hypothetical protein
LDTLLADANASQHVLARANGVALRITRQLTFIGETAVGKYGQDSYGSSTLLDPVPMLACLRQYKEAGPGSDTEKLLWTKLIRLRHQITDAIELARVTIADFRVNLADNGKAPPTTGK